MIKNEFVIRKDRLDYGSKLYKQIIFYALEKNTKKNIDQKFPKLLGFGFDHITNFIVGLHKQTKLLP